MRRKGKWAGEGREGLLRGNLPFDRDSWQRGCPVFLPWTWLYKAVIFRAETVFWWLWDVSSKDENPNCWGWIKRKKLNPGWHHWAAARSLKISALDFLLYDLIKSLCCWSHHQIFCQGQLKAFLWNTHSDQGMALGVSFWQGRDDQSATVVQARSHHVDH